MSTSDELLLLQASHVWIQFDPFVVIYDQFTDISYIRIKILSPI